MPKPQPAPTTPSHWSLAARVLLWSSLALVLCSVLAGILPHPARLLPAWIGVAGSVVAFVALCPVVWRKRWDTSTVKTVDKVYAMGAPIALTVNQIGAVVAVLLLGLFAAMMAFAWNMFQIYSEK